MKILQPVKIRKTGRVLGYFYRYCGDGRIQYISFDSNVVAIAESKITAATPQELEAAKAAQRMKGQRGPENDKTELGKDGRPNAHDLSPTT